MSTRMVCSYDPQQCDYPRCLNKGNPNYYDQRCAEREIESVLRTAKNIANEVDRISNQTNGTVKMKVSIGRSKKVTACAHVIIRHWDDGIDIELFEVEGIDGKNKLIEMPEDGKLVRVMNDQGKEVDRLEWRD